MSAALPGCDPIEQLKAHDAAIRKLAQAATEFLNELLPPGSRHSRALGFVRDAFVEWMCCGSDRQIAALETMRKADAELKTQHPEWFVEKSLEQQMVEATDRVHILQEQIDNAEKARDAFPVEEMRPMLDQTLVQPLKSQLEFLEAQVSQIQRRMEADSANAQTPEPESLISEDRQQQNELGESPE